MALVNFIPWVRRSVTWWLLFVIALLVCRSPLAGAEFSLFKSKSKSEAAQDATAARLKEIEQATKGFADRYVTYLVDSCERVQTDDPDPEARKQALRLKLFHSASVYGIAASPNPLGQLLDLCVVVTLGKMNWVEEGREVLRPQHRRGQSSAIRLCTGKNRQRELGRGGAGFDEPGYSVKRGPASRSRGH